MLHQAHQGIFRHSPRVRLPVMRLLQQVDPRQAFPRLPFLPSRVVSQVSVRRFSLPQVSLEKRTRFLVRLLLALLGPVLVQIRVPAAQVGRWPHALTVLALTLRYRAQPKWCQLWSLAMVWRRQACLRLSARLRVLWPLLALRLRSYQLQRALPQAWGPRQALAWV